MADPATIAKLAGFRLEANRIRNGTRSMAEQLGGLKEDDAQAVRALLKTSVALCNSMSKLAGVTSELTDMVYKSVKEPSTAESLFGGFFK